MEPRPWIMSFIILLMVLVECTGSHWGQWSQWGQCSRTCDGGARYQTRRCLKRRSNKFRCTGETIRYSTCNNDPCPANVPDFRSEQCAAYNDASYSGHVFKWLAYHNPDNPCSLTCIAEGTQTVAVLAPKVLDGTRCDTHTMNMCINGKCMKVGCDHVLHSKVVPDTCGVCGGNNSTCVRGDHRVPGSFRWIQTGYGACSVTCGVGVKDKRLLCFNTLHGRIMDSTYCDNLIRPQDTRSVCRPGPCPAEWRAGPWQNCTRDCGGGISWRVVTCIQTFEDGTQQLMRDRYCDGESRPSSRKSCNGQICPRWYAGQWSVCSSSCGKGIQKREVICRHVGEQYCREKDKPRTSKECSTGMACYLNGDIQERNVGEFTSNRERPQSDQAITKDDLRIPRFVTTTWDLCSATCGEGVKFRFVRCQVFLPFLNDFADLPDQDCNETKPAEYEPCYASEPCYDLYEWIQTGMTECSQSCLGGIQESILKCILKENGTVVNDSYCAEAPHVQAERRICNVQPCPQRWEVSSFGECSKTCGGGVKTRNVSCIQAIAQGPIVINMPDFMCGQPIPDRAMPCNTKYCPAQWSVGYWSDCSVTCGLGLRVRPPLCQRVKNGKLSNVSYSDCDINLKPETEMECNMTKCPDPEIKTKYVKFVQFNKIKRLKLVVGMVAKVLPETDIVLKCPHVGLDRQKITWFKNGLKFKRTKNARVSRSGALRMRSARLGRDDGVYSCLVGGLEANVTIDFTSSIEIIQSALYKEKFLTGKASNENSLLNKTILYMDVVDRKKRPLTLVSTDWSRCSVTCGGGLQSRNMSCEIITEAYYQVLPKEECYKGLTTKPAAIQSCNINPCVKWRTGDWAECSSDKCVRPYYSVQSRAVDCINEFNETITEDKYCKDLGFPPDKLQDCYHPGCTMTWQTSKWSECIGNCGEEGYKTRSLTCIWSESGKITPTNTCNNLQQPKVSRKCTVGPCDVCEDESDYCSIIEQMNMCDFSNFNERCCLTCNPIYYDEEYYDAPDEES
ncbi:ADAMTS-like protein 3 [Mactra antiquata]